MFSLTLFWLPLYFVFLSWWSVGRHLDAKNKLGEFLEASILTQKRISLSVLGEVFRNHRVEVGLHEHPQVEQPHLSDESSVSADERLYWWDQLVGNHTRIDPRCCVSELAWVAEVQVLENVQKVGGVGCQKNGANERGISRRLSVHPFAKLGAKNVLLEAEYECESLVTTMMMDFFNGAVGLCWNVAECSLKVTNWLNNSYGVGNDQLTESQDQGKRENQLKHLFLSFHNNLNDVHKILFKLHVFLYDIIRWRIFEKNKLVKFN